MKIDRQAVYDKFGGRCAYCGNMIRFEDMQVDHFKPQRAFDGTQGGNEFENLMPSCRRCNHYKRANPLEIFRQYLLDMRHKVLDDTYLGKIPVDYGMVEWKGWDGLFYFERESTPPKEDEP